MVGSRHLICPHFCHRHLFGQYSTERVAETQKWAKAVFVWRCHQPSASDVFSNHVVFARVRSCRSLWGEGRGGWIDLFFREGDGFETECVTNTKATTDENDPFLHMGFKHGIKWVDKNARSGYCLKSVGWHILWWIRSLVLHQSSVQVSSLSGKL